MTVPLNPNLSEDKTLSLQSITWGTLTWLNIERPTELEIEYLTRNYHFHPLDLDDCLSRIQRPKLDEYKDYLFMVLHLPVLPGEMQVATASQVSIFISDNYLITLHKGDLKPLVKFFRECEIDEGFRAENFGKGSGYLLYSLIDKMIDYCFPILSSIGASIENTEDEIFSNSSLKTIEEISILRRDVIAFRRIIWPMRAVLGSLEPKVRRYTSMDLEIYFGDTVDHVDKIWDGLDEYKEIIEGLNDTYDSMVSNRTNIVMRMLTVVATILLPITVVTGIFGMNVPLPMQESVNSLLLVFGSSTVVTILMLMFLRYKKWM